MINIETYINHNKDNISNEKIIEFNNRQILYQYIDNNDIIIYRYCLRFQRWYWILVLMHGWHANEFSYNLCDLSISHRLYHRIFHISTNEYFIRFCDEEAGNYIRSYNKIIKHVKNNLEMNLLFRYISQNEYDQFIDKYIFYQWYLFKQSLLNICMNYNNNCNIASISIYKFLQNKNIQINEGNIYQLIDLDNNKQYNIYSNYSQLDLNNCMLTNDNNNIINKYYIRKINQFYILINNTLSFIQLIKLNKYVLYIIELDNKHLYNNIIQQQLCNSYLAHRINKQEYNFLRLNIKNILYQLIKELVGNIK